MPIELADNSNGPFRKRHRVVYLVRPNTTTVAQIRPVCVDTKAEQTKRNVDQMRIQQTKQTNSAQVRISGYLSAFQMQQAFAQSASLRCSIYTRVNDISRGRKTWNESSAGNFHSEKQWLQRKTWNVIPLRHFSCYRERVLNLAALIN